MTEEHLTEPPVAGNEADTLVGSLERMRRTFIWKASSGLDAAGMRATTAASSMTLGGLIKHLALVEDDYFSHRLWGNDYQPVWNVDWDSDPDWEWRTAADDSPEELVALWTDTVARSRTLIAKALSEGGGLDRPQVFTWPDGRTPTLRRMLVDLIEEYARHTGHADIIRESVDGLTGEDPPAQG